MASKKSLKKQQQKQEEDKYEALKKRAKEVMTLFEQDVKKIQAHVISIEKLTDDYILRLQKFYVIKWLKSFLSFKDEAMVVETLQDHEIEWMEVWREKKKGKKGEDKFDFTKYRNALLQQPEADLSRIPHDPEEVQDRIKQQQQRGKRRRVVDEGDEEHRKEKRERREAQEAQEAAEALARANAAPDFGLDISLDTTKRSFSAPEELLARGRQHDSTPDVEEDEKSDVEDVAGLATAESETGLNLCLTNKEQGGQGGREQQEQEVAFADTVVQLASAVSVLDDTERKTYNEVVDAGALLEEARKPL
ncbi:hypothetical protein B484DRAFT_406422 [Ochromonadaceae sp. CCMP2298]|nr:hypothetical protein B484DRAFT_406422 [Ochromonadaceae sp. CCMP2298]